MSFDQLFSFDSPNSLHFSIGSVSFAINADYIAKMKFLFNEASLYPTNEDRDRIVTAHNMVVALVTTNSIPIRDRESEQISYFARKFLDPNCDYYSADNFEYLQTMLSKLLNEVDLWIAQNEEKIRRKNEAINSEIKLMDIEEHRLREKIRVFLSSHRSEMSSDEESYFLRVGRNLRHTYNMWLYRIILDDEIAEFYFLHNMRASSLKAKFIVQCIEHKNTHRAKELIDLLIKTSTYVDYAPKGGNKWELTALNTIRDVLYEYLPDNSEWKENYTIETRLFVISLTEWLKPYLTSESQKELLGRLALIDPYHRYEQEYIDTLLDDVSHYAQIKRPRGWGSARVVNRISSEIIDSFSILEELERVDVIVSLLSTLKEAGSALTPINYDRWLNEFCQENVSEEAFEIINERLS